MEYEGIEQEILLEPENAIVSAVYSVNGKTGDVVLTTSDLENDSDYQTGDEVDAAIATAIAGKQDTLTAGNNIQISAENVISATDTTYSAGNGLNLSSENAFSVDTTVVATQQNLATEVQNRENADNALQAQIDGISASSDVVDIVGTYADLQNYDTSKLKDNDIIKVLQDETQNDATTYYRWSTSTETFTLIGQEGPYYTKSAADAQFVPQTRTVNGKALSTNITLNASDVSALGTSDVVQTTGTSTSQVMSQNTVTNELNTKLNAADYVVDDTLADSTNPVQNKVLYSLLGDMPTDFFTGAATSSDSGTELQFNGAMMVDDVQLNGDTTQQTYTGKNLAVNAYQGPVTSGGVTFTTNADGSISTSGVASANINFYLSGSATPYSLDEGTYTLSIGDVTSSDTTCFVYIDGVGQVYWDSRSDSRTTQTVPAGGITINVRIVVRSGADMNGLTFKIQLESGSTATSYEPYVGGTASPNPDYPQDVQVVTGTQTVYIHGKNLVNIQNMVKGRVDNGVVGYANNTTDLTISGNDVTFTTNAAYRGVASDLISVKPNTNYVQSYGFVSGMAPYVAYYDSSKNWISNGTPSNIITPVNCAYLRLSYQLNSAGTATISNLQLEQGSTATTYEPYQGQDYTVNLGSLELCKIRTYQDYIYKSGDDWYVHKALGKITLDGTQNIAIANWRATATSVGWIYSYNVTQNVPVQFNTDIPAILSDKLMVRTYVQLYDSLVDNGIAVYFNTSLGVVIKTDDTSLTTTTAINNYLNSNPITVYYALATATDTQITDGTLIGQLNALYNAKMLAGQTNFAVSAVSPNLPAILDITVFNANAQGLISSIRGN